MKNSLLKFPGSLAQALREYRMLAGGALFVAAVTYATGCCCPCYYPTDIPVAEATPLAPKVLPKMKDFKAPALDVGAQAINY